MDTFRRFANGSLAADEVLLRYRIRSDQPKFAINAFFFQEQHGQYYQAARYGEFRIDAEGEALLVALRGAELQVLGPPGGGRGGGRSMPAAGILWGNAG